MGKTTTLIDFDDILEEKYGKIGTPERNKFEKNVKAYRDMIEKVEARLGLEKIENEEQYEWAVNRVEELLPLVNDNTPIYDENYVELELISLLVSDYSEEHYSLDKL